MGDDGLPLDDPDWNVDFWLLVPERRAQLLELAPVFIGGVTHVLVSDGITRVAAIHGATGSVVVLRLPLCNG